MKVKDSIERFRKLAIFVLTLFIAPLAISLLADILIQLARGLSAPLWQYLITAIFGGIFILFLIAGYTDKLDGLALALEATFRSRRFKKPRVLILDGKIGDGHEVPPKPIITDFQPKDWTRALAEQVKGWRIEIGPIRDILKPQAYQLDF